MDKVLLEHRHAHMVYNSFSATTAELSSCDRDPMAHTQNIYYLTLQKVCWSLKKNIVIM